MKKISYRMTTAAALAAVLTLSACGSSDDNADTTADETSDQTAAASGGTPNVNTDGPAVCIDKALEHLGPDAMINEIDSSFVVSDDIDPPLVPSDEGVVPGDLFRCSAQYQDPEDPVKLLQIDYDIETGQWEDPKPVEITVSGDAASFDLNDYVIPASSIDTSSIGTVMADQDARLTDTFSIWNWDYVTLTGPGTFSDVHLFNLGFEGRLAANDIAEDGSVSFPVDGSAELVDDSLLD